MLIGGALIALAFICGAVPFGLLVGKLYRIDVRQLGSGNIGATNVGRALGLHWAVLVLLLDAAKGAAPVWLATAVLNHVVPPWTGLAAMVAAVSGHVFSPFLGFRGGKGVATGLGVTLAIAPIVAGVGLAAYSVTFAIFRVSALGSLSGLAAVLATMVLSGAPIELILTLSAIAGLILFKHRSNLRQLWAWRWGQR